MNGRLVMGALAMLWPVTARADPLERGALRLEWSAPGGCPNGVEREDERPGIELVERQARAAETSSRTAIPYCNACMCAVPCDGGRDCPRGITGHEADCISSATTTPSCFLVCDDGLCPTGMTCTKCPGTDRLVYMWLSEPPIVEPPV